ncbi:MAG: hypothetical protein M3401_02095 [Actinomycetota bacterium]|nr:hypothetical protein [Actinomycetota bacterium]
MFAVQPQYGPTLLQLLAARPRRVRIAAGAFTVLLVIATVVIALRSRPDETVVLVREPITFNFAYGPQYERVTRPGALLALRRMRGDRFLESYVIRDLRLPRYRGAVGGMLPLYSDGHMRRLRQRYPGARLVNEGRTRLNNGVGYQVTFRGVRDGRALYIRHFLVVPELPDGQRRGVLIELETTFAAGTPNAESVGAVGPLKMALRSFRFGEDREGGTA